MLGQSNTCSPRLVKAILIEPITAAKCAFPRLFCPWARACRSRIRWERTLAAAVFSMCVIINVDGSPAGQLLIPIMGNCLIGNLPSGYLSGCATHLLLRPCSAVLL